VSVKLTVLWKGNNSGNASPGALSELVAGNVIQGVIQQSGRAAAVTIERADLERLLAERRGGTRSALQAVKESFAEVELMREQGISWAEIAELLGRNGAVGRDGKAFSAATVRAAFFLVGAEIRQGQLNDSAAEFCDPGLRFETAIEEGLEPADADAPAEPEPEPEPEPELEPEPAVTVATEPEPVATAEPEAVIPEAEPEPDSEPEVITAPEPEPEAVRLEAANPAEPEPEPEPFVQPEPEPEPEPEITMPVESPGATIAEAAAAEETVEPPRFARPLEPSHPPRPLGVSRPAPRHDDMLLMMPLHPAAVVAAAEIEVERAPEPAPVRTAPAVPPAAAPRPVAAKPEPPEPPPARPAEPTGAAVRPLATGRPAHEAAMTWDWTRRFDRST